MSDLRNKAKELLRICHDSVEPVFITKNGEGGMVLMSLAAYEPLRSDSFLDAIESLDELSERGATPRDSVLQQRGCQNLNHRVYRVFYESAAT